jgi:membrane protein
VLQAADESHLPFLASAVTFDALLAAIPFLLLLIIGLTFIAEHLTGARNTDPLLMFHRFLPPHVTTGGSDPFAVVENLLARITRNRGAISLYAAPAFVWFSTRLFGSLRTSLNDIFDTAVRPPRQRNPVVAYLLSKARDTAMVLATLMLFLANTLLSTGLAIAQERGAAALTRFPFLVSTAGRLLGELLTIVFSISLFFIVYKYASVRKLRWRTALLASAFSAIAFEVAKRLYAIYLTDFASFKGSGGDATIGAIVLFVIWIHYTALVFLLGGVVAETWELRRMQRRQRAILT